MGSCNDGHLQAWADRGRAQSQDNRDSGHTLAAQLEQTTTLLQNIDATPTTVLLDLGYRGVEYDFAPVQVFHRSEHKTVTSPQRIWHRRRHAIKPAIGHTRPRFKIAFSS